MMSQDAIDMMLAEMNVSRYELRYAHNVWNAGRKIAVMRMREADLLTAYEIAAAMRTRYLKLTSHDSGIVYVAEFDSAKFRDSAALARILGWIDPDDYTIRFSDRKLRTNVRTKFVENMNYLYQ